MPHTEFHALPLMPELQTQLSALGFTEMTAVQRHVLPQLLAGQNLVVQAPTGAGKTLAFGLTLLQSISRSQRQVQGLVVCPTRELAEQVTARLQALAKGMANTRVLCLAGGTPLAPQQVALQQGVHLVVGTPGRLADLLARGDLSLAELELMVLDEADQLMIPSLQQSMAAIASAIPKGAQRLLFSATFPAAQRDDFAQWAQGAEQVLIQPEQERVAQFQLVLSDERKREQALLAWLSQAQPSRALLFNSTRAQARELAKMLVRAGHSALALHADLDQGQRERVLLRFANGSARLLVATDVAARGLDLPELPWVCNVQLPDSAETYLHRIGRAGRQGDEGQAVSLLNEVEQARLVQWQGGLLTPYALNTGTAENTPLKAEMLTLELAAGKKQRLRPGDLLGALTQALAAEAVGEIRIRSQVSFVAVKRTQAQRALQQLQQHPIKGQQIPVRLLLA
ncbi:DEAD/DEAH box helicase [Ferrimonas marina]|uniref:ATP-independent RNA helicase DbpA n=1 Tax=Ferrimonas marina TaxID=299255 RepID=A0A1M5YTF8_9GAMM|nr:DEAD/DEAH box helicase [Ferrimonas marina]SHI15362.1 ATP-independent RNA helicase DbpA [Ferrimonas marina]